MGSDSQCMLDGTFQPCSMVFRAAAAGGLKSIDMPPFISGTVPNRRPVRVIDPDTTDPPTTDPNNPEINYSLTIYEHYHYEWVPTGDTTTSIQQRQPQKPPDRRLTKDEYLTLRGELAKALQSKKCRGFIDRLISSSQGGMHYDSEEDFLAFSDYIYNSSDGGIFWRQGDGGQVGHIIRIGDGIRLDLNLEIYAATLMHELIHGLQGRGSDDTLDRNIRDLGIVPIGKDGKPLPFPTGMRDGKPFNDWSGYWHTALKNACFPNARN